MEANEVEIEAEGGAAEDQDVELDLPEQPDVPSSEIDMDMEIETADSPPIIPARDDIHPESPDPGQAATAVAQAEDSAALPAATNTSAPPKSAQLQTSTAIPTPVNPVERWVPRPSSAATNTRPASPNVPASALATFAKLQTDSYAPVSSYTPK